MFADYSFVCGLFAGLLVLGLAGQVAAKDAPAVRPQADADAVIADIVAGLAKTGSNTIVVNGAAFPAAEH